MAHTLDGAKAGTRPVSFLYNGGPGAASLWLHMGPFSPVRLLTDSPNPTPGPPFKLVNNDDSLLDKPRKPPCAFRLHASAKRCCAMTARLWTAMTCGLRASTLRPRTRAPVTTPQTPEFWRAFVAALHGYLDGELKYQRDDAYRPSADSIGQWERKHRRTSGRPGMSPGGEQSQPYVATDLASAIRKNPHLKVFSANGYFDLATPLFATEYDLAHMGLASELRANVQFGYYPSGHMIYLNIESLHKLKSDLAAFITGAQKQK